MKKLKLMLLTKRYLNLLLALAFFNFGCAHIRPIPRQSSVNFGDKKVKIILTDSSEGITAHYVQVAPDSVSYIDTKTSMKKSIATADVEEIITVNHGQGAAEGFGVGLLTGLAMVGLSVALTAGEEHDGDGPSAAAIWIGLAVVGGAGFTLLSTMIGAAGGSKDIYVFNEKKDAHQRR